MLRLSQLVALSAVLAAPALAQSTSWRWTRQAFHPDAGGGGSLAYDHSRARIVCFGGSNWQGGENLDETFEWDGHAWLLRHPTSSPPGRDFAALADDPLGQGVVLFGGERNSSFLADTWHWDGSVWQQVSSGIGPAPRWFHSMATDWQRQKIILFGGAGITGARMQDTWEWDGTQWTQRFPSHIPAARCAQGMAFDGHNGMVAMYGGQAIGNLPTLPVYEWDGSDWVIVPTQGLDPGVLANPVAMPDPNNGDTLIFGLVETPPYRNLMFRWNGSDFAILTSANQVPAFGTYGTLASDAVRHEVVQFGGRNPLDSDYRNTWIYEPAGDTWRLAGGLGPLVNPVLWTHVPWSDSYFGVEHPWTYGVDPQRTWLMTDGGYTLLDTTMNYSQVAQPFAHAATRSVYAYDPLGSHLWLWNGHWTDVTPQGTAQDMAHAGYDTELAVNWFVSPSGVWAWTGWSWVQVASGLSLGSVGTILPVFDPVRRVLSVVSYNVLPAGGLGWVLTEFDGRTWTAPVLSPTNLPASGYAYVPGVGCVYSRSDLGEWIWDGAQWHPFTCQDRPASITFFHAYDACRNRLLASRISDSAWFAQYYFLEPATLTPSDDTPRMGSQLQLSLQVPSEPAALWFVGLSGDSYPGIPVGSLADNPYRVIPLAADGLLAASVALGIGGSLDLQGNGQVQFHIPIDPSLFDVSFHAAALTITPSWTIGHISPSVWIHITP